MKNKEKKKAKAKAKKKAAGWKEKKEKQKKSTPKEKQRTERPAFAPAQWFQILSDESRIQILERLREKEQCGLELLESVKIAQSTLSHHMKVLCGAGIVRCRKQGKKIYYSLNREEIGRAAEYLRFLEGKKGKVKDENGKSERTRE